MKARPIRSIIGRGSRGLEDPAGSAVGRSGSFGIGRGGFSLGAAVAWAVVGIPIVWGIGITLSKAFILFR